MLCIYVCIYLYLAASWGIIICFYLHSRAHTERLLILICFAMDSVNYSFIYFCYDVYVYVFTLLNCT